MSDVELYTTNIEYLTILHASFGCLSLLFSLVLGLQSRSLKSELSDLKQLGALSVSEMYDSLLKNHRYKFTSNQSTYSPPKNYLVQGMVNSKSAISSIDN